MDNNGTKCTDMECKGIFGKSYPVDDINGLLHCNVCGKRISRYTSDKMPCMERLYDALCHEDKRLKANAPEECKGRFYRYRISEYGGADTLGRRETFTLLKRMSCQGCEQCEGSIEYLDNYVCEIGCLPPHPHLDDFDIVTPVWISQGYDYESGYTEYELEFQKVKNDC